MANTDMNRPSVVYTATNLVNGKMYVGVTTKGRLGRRIYEHDQAAARMSKKTNSKFYNAIRKYGIKNFFFEEVGHYSTMTEGFVAEIKLIAELAPAYNSTKGGEGWRGGSLDLTEEERESIRARHRGNKYRLGKTHTPEAREKLRQAALANTAGMDKIKKMEVHPASKTVVCLNDGKIYKSASHAARVLGLDKNVLIQVCERHKRRFTVGGDLVFRYFGDHEGGVDEVADLLKRRRILSKKVACISDGIVLSSLLKAAKRYGIARMTLQRHCEDGRPLKNGMTFKYVEAE
jgi:group I intron endonuclease